MSKRKPLADGSEEFSDGDGAARAPLPFQKDGEKGETGTVAVVILLVPRFGASVIWLRDGRRCDPGEIVDVPVTEAEELIDAGRAIRECDLKPIEVRRTSIATQFRTIGNWGYFQVSNDGRVMREVGAEQRAFEATFDSSAFGYDEEAPERERRIEAAIPGICEKVVADGLKRGFRVTLI